jgi:hypothetical protein
MNFICKIVEDKPEDRQIIVKYCRQNSPKPIDEYKKYAVDYDLLDFSDYESFVYSIMKCGQTPIIDALVEEKCLECNHSTEPSYSTIISDNLNKILSIDYKEIIYGTDTLNKIDL